MNRVKTFAVILLLALAVPAATFAQADFTTYVAFGDSLTAGFWSGGLVRTVQATSYPSIIHRAATGAASGFEQPLVSEPGIPSTLRLASLVPLAIAPQPGLGAPQNLLLPRPYNNMAVPGADVHDLVATVTDGGGLHDLILRGTGFTQLQQGLSLQPTFVTLWIGNNDALAAATSGRVIEDVTLTSVARFEADFRAAVTAIATPTPAPRIAIANIPNVTSIPFVTTLSRFLVNPTTQQPVLINGQPVPLIGPNGPLAAGDFVLLSATAELALGRGIPVALGGSGQPLSDGAVLSAAEAATISARVGQYNQIIATVANERGAALVDINSLLVQASTRGVPVGGIVFTSAFLTGGIFSYDGVHPSAFGYAYVAKVFIDAINARFGEDIPPPNLGAFILGSQSQASVAGSALGEPSRFTPFVFTREATRKLHEALGVPKWVSDGLAKPPRRGRGRGRG
jgi:lysophospholipase L1-like esterase